MLVTGGLGGLGLIASFHAAAEWENPIITTSRSGRLPPGGPSSLGVYESIKEMVPMYNVKLDIGNSKDVCDFMAWVQRPGVPAEDRSMVIDDIIKQLRYKMDKMPADALRLILEFLMEVKDKMYEILVDLRTKETKINPDTLMEMQAKDEELTEVIRVLKQKVGNVGRTGMIKLTGGVVPGNYSISGPEAIGEQQHKVDESMLLELMREEMQQQDGQQQAEGPNEEQPRDGAV